ncbi:diguanylate cyclase [Helicobacter sp.]|uniref:diguanylate cyclase domain-containing protein n=1 Tax=Helicobacter sp. TaxID=218 RepID=UPI0025C32DFF|nr:diguanylate cyclase [Helicobacter sp.]MCI5633523.1 diguanylate cyclase [Helicobacter sp.]MDY5557247.1 diguanylate cyclase [Helicobacter sp.]
MKDDFGSFEGLQSFEARGIGDSNSENTFSSFGMDDSAQSENSNVSKSDTAAGTLGEYGLKVIQELSANGIAPTPYNYRIYFEKLLANQTQQLKDNASQHVENDQRPAEQQVALEAKVIKAQSYMVNTLQQVGVLVKNLRLMQGILRKHEQEVETTNNAIAIQNIIAVFQKELDKLGEVIEHQLLDVKNAHDKAVSAIEDINNGVICNSAYGIYNRRFLEKRVESEAESGSIGGGYKSSLILVHISKNLEKRVNSDKTASIINRSLSKILQKVANRSDIVAYYENGIFGILLSHSDKEEAKHFANRLIEKVVATNIIIGDEEISLNVCTGIAEINELTKPKDIIKNALEALKKAINNNISFVVYGAK